jgi:hypothetical protein
LTQQLTQLYAAQLLMAMPSEPFPTYIEPKAFDPESMTADGRLGLENLRSLSVQERHALTQGEIKVDVLVGDKWICKMPWRLFQAMSTKAGDTEICDHTTRQLRIPAGLSGKPFVYILDWLEDITGPKRFYLLRRRDSITEDVAICRAARLLGMMEYAQHIFNHYWALFKNTTPSFEEISAVERLALTEDNIGLVGHDAAVFLDCIAKRLAHLVYKDEIPDKEALSAYLQQHPKLMSMVAEALSAVTVEQSRLVSATAPRSEQTGLERVQENSTLTPWSTQTTFSQEFRGVHQPNTAGSFPSPGLALSKGLGEMMSQLQRVRDGELYLAQNVTRSGTQSPSRLDPMAKSFPAILNEGDENTSTKLHHQAQAKRLSVSGASLNQSGTALPKRTQSNLSDAKISAVRSPWTNKLTAERNAGIGKGMVEHHVQGQKANPDGNGQTPQGIQGPSLIEAAKKLFPPPPNSPLPYMWAVQHTLALREQNALFREQRYAASINPDFQFSNPTWKYDVHAFVQKELQYDAGVIGHGANQGPQDGGHGWTTDGKGTADRASTVGIIGDRGH